ncbi:MAG: putative decaprenylphosphoryl-beta-D-ribose oxidase [Myxococcales bacterium]|nr:putative decaprenylphosphoryl-beta-D-ribose oxidase [Myxococcales bacterium]
MSLRKKSVSHQVPKSGDLRHRDDKIDISDLDEVLSVDPEKRLCVAESGVTFVDLVTATMKHDLVPIVVPELKTITIGGAVAGCSIESMSFVHGGFHDTCVEYEVITAKGEVLRCTPDNEHSLVFQMVHGAFGTLGILSKLVFKLVPAKRFVKLTYEKHTTLAAYQQAIKSHYELRDIDFMDGIIHSPSLYVLCAGNFVDSAPYTSSYDWMKVYYQSTKTRSEDYLTTPNYFFRYDRGVTNVRPSSFLGRLLFGKLMSSSEWLRLAEKFHWLLPKRRPTVTLDVFVPFSKAPEFMRWYEREFAFFPLWCVPYKRVHDYEWLADDYWKQLDDSLFLDLAIYGMKQRGERNAHRMMEEKLREIGGIKTLIAHNYYPEAEFWQIFNKPNYAAVKAKTDPQNLFRDLYTKTCRTAMGEMG